MDLMCFKDWRGPALRMRHPVVNGIIGEGFGSQMTRLAMFSY